MTHATPEPTGPPAGASPSVQDVVHTTLAGDAVARAVAAGWSCGVPIACRLLRRGFNDVYVLEFADGHRRVARLSARRARGPANDTYEAALLAHLNAGGARVAVALPTPDGAPSVSLACAEGERRLMLYEHLPGEPPGDALPGIEATGRGLAQLHDAGESFTGDALSRYRLELPHLLHQPLQWLLAASTLDAELRRDFDAIAQRVARRIEADDDDGGAALARVACHGDCHGGNSFVTTEGSNNNDGEEGERVAAFFDFDDAGSGYLAYDLSVFLWRQLLRRELAAPDTLASQRWQAFVRGYRSRRTIAPVDFDAIARFVCVRHFWFMGEYASRMPEWGTQTMPPSWLRKQVGLLQSWEALRTPEA